MKTFKIAQVFSQLQTWNPFTEKHKFDPLKKGSDKRYSYQIKNHKVFNFDIDQDDIKTAIIAAEVETDPRRILLMQVYRETLRDLHVRSQIETAINKVLSPPWAIVDEETYEINEELTRLMQKKWFEKLRRFFVLEEFEGTKLVELGQFKETKHGWELISVKEFPAELVLPKKGLIVPSPYGQTGIPYRPEDLPEGATKEIKQLAEQASEFFIEIGDHDNLGLLQYIAPNSTYKKYAKGDWARSSEKWIDPVTIIRSSSDDDAENDKKAESAENMGNNSWMILDKEDEVDLLERKNASGFKTTQEWLHYLDADNSKGANGQVATSDEKSFVGSAEVQERILDDYTDRRSRSMTYWLNEDVLPKLIALNEGNTAYSQLEGHLFMPLQNLGEEEDDDDDSSSGGEEDEKPTNHLNPGRGSVRGKSRAPQISGYGLAIDVQSCCASIASESLVLMNDLSKLLEQFVKRIYTRKIRPGKIDSEVAKANADKVWNGMKRGFNDNLTNVKFGSPEHRLKVQLRYNVFVMAAFKNHHNTLDLHNLLFNGDGTVKTFSAFKKDVLAVNEKYNVNWLNAEYKLGKANARMASKWMVYQGKGGSLVYLAVLDGNARAEHEALHGATFPVNHAFWTTYYPPNGWGCRCDVRWIRREETKEPASRPSLKAEHQNNPGITGKVFNSDHPYFEVAKKFEKQAKKIFGFDLPLDLDKFNANLSVFETLKADKNYKLSHASIENGGVVFQHLKHGKDELKDNLTVAKKLANDRGDAVVLKAISDQRTNDALVNGIEYEFKKSGQFTNIARSIQSAFKAARNQGAERMIVQIGRKVDADKLIKGVGYGFHYSPTIKEIELWINGKQIVVNVTSYLEAIKKSPKKLTVVNLKGQASCLAVQI